MDTGLEWPSRSRQHAAFQGCRRLRGGVIGVQERMSEVVVRLVRQGTTAPPSGLGSFIKLCILHISKGEYNQHKGLGPYIAMSSCRSAAGTTALPAFGIARGGRFSSNP